MTAAGVEVMGTDDRAVVISLVITSPRNPA
jgi:hypothetical protein